MFKKNDYIVLLRCKYGSSPSFPLNFCYKQEINGEYITPYLDNNLHTDNGWSIHPYNKSQKNDWRYATHEEIQEYDRLDKPFDTTLFIPPLYEIY